MSVLTVKNISHGFGDRAIFEDVSFRLLKGEHRRKDACQKRREFGWKSARWKVN